jgi:hypothetical protein
MSAAARQPLTAAFSRQRRECGIPSRPGDCSAQIRLLLRETAAAGATETKVETVEQRITTFILR